MRIVNRTEFLTLPAGTVFMKFPEQSQDEDEIDLAYDRVISIKETSGKNDFGVQDLFPWFEGANDTSDWVEIMAAMLRGEPSPAVDYDCPGRDGLFEERKLFLVWEKDDLKRMIDRLNEALLSGYPE